MLLFTLGKGMYKDIRVDNAVRYGKSLESNSLSRFGSLISKGNEEDSQFRDTRQSPMVIHILSDNGFMQK